MIKLSQTTIRSTARVKFLDWLPLWNGIHAYHGSSEIPLEVSRHTFNRQRMGKASEGALRGLVAFCDDVPVGFAHYYLHRSSYQIDPISTLEDLFVLEEYRGRGIGQGLIRQVWRRVSELGATEIRWVTMPSNAAALKLYDRNGQREELVCYRCLF